MGHTVGSEWRHGHTRAHAVSGFVRDLSVLRQVKACPEGRMASQGDGIKTCKRESIGRSLHLSGRKTQTPESHLSWNRLLVIDSSGLASRQGKRRAAQWPEPPTGVHLHQSDTPNSLRCAPWGHRALRHSSTSPMAVWEADGAPWA